MDFNNEVPKHIKRKKLSISKSKMKSKHKHIYEDCLLLEGNRRPHKSTYCKICGKVGEVKFFETEKADYGAYRMLNSEEVFEKYRSLPQIHVKDIFQKYISINVEK